MSAMESPGHTVRINPAPKKPKVEAIPERESFPPGPPSTMSEETWQGMQPVLKALGATVNTKKQKVDAVYVNLDTRPDRRESIEEQLAKTGALRPFPPGLTLTFATHPPCPLPCQASRPSA